MKSVHISLNSIDRVKKFVNVVNRYESDFDLASDRYVVDAKSIMGIFSLDVTNVLRLDVHDDACFDDVCSDLKDYIV